MKVIPFLLKFRFPSLGILTPYSEYRGGEITSFLPYSLSRRRLATLRPSVAQTTPMTEVHTNHQRNLSI